MLFTACFVSLFTQVLDAIVKEHEKIFEAACDYATQLASGDNIRSGDLLLVKVVELQELWEELKVEVEQRDNILQQAQLAQQVCVHRSSCVNKSSFLLISCMVHILIYSFIMMCQRMKYGSRNFLNHR